MKAVVKTVDGIAVAEVDAPKPKPTELLVKVRAGSLNRADLFLAEGRAHGQHGGAGTVLGLEWAGDVLEVGADASGFSVGDKVLCSGIGGLAEIAVADARRCLPFPRRSIDYDAASGLTVAARTTFVSLNDLGRLEPGQSVLVLGASSAVGMMCLQVAKLMGAGLVIGTSTKRDRRERLAEFGADAALDSGDADWAAQVAELTNGKGIDLLVDFLAGPLMNDAMRATRIGGRIVNVGRMAGEAGQMDFDLHSMRQIQYLGQTFRTRSADEVADIGRRTVAALWPALERGELGLPVDARFPLDEAEAAFAMMKRNGHFGKIVITT